MRTLAAALLAGGAIVGTGVAASPASAAVPTHGVATLSHNSLATGGGCGFGGFNRGFNRFCGFGGFGGLGGFGFSPFAFSPFGFGFGNTSPVVIIVR
ncbi:hypothetical protein ABZ922_40140 [Streptomyces shenzhenensis]|uniref:hypothetical protein n=1 Tax=Streptomyces shenzhenensis TaxID=943815 RepID=UPI003407475C